MENIEDTLKDLFTDTNKEPIFRLEYNNFKGKIYEHWLDWFDIVIDTKEMTVFKTIYNKQNAINEVLNAFNKYLESK